MTTRGWPDRADVVVVGGGILGCSAAYHLHEAGAGRVLLIEQAPDLGMQTSWAGAGFVSLWAAGAADELEPELEMERYALHFYRQLGAEHDIGFKPVGFGWIALTPQGDKRLAERYARASTILAPEELQLLSADQVVDLVPILVPSRVCSSLFFPTAIRVSAPDATRALGRVLAAMGVQVHIGVEVTAIEVGNGRVSGVLTSEGRISTATVVNAAGAWLHRIAQMIDASLPVTPLVVPRLVTEPIPGLPPRLPMMIIEDYHGIWIREEEGGLLVGLPGKELSGDRDVPLDSPPDVRTLPTETIRRVEQLAREFASTLPAFGELRVKDRRSGLPTYTPDGRHVLGPVEEVAGFYVLGGDNEVGISHAPGLGKLLAELIVAGKASRDISAYRLDRFATRL